MAAPKCFMLYSCVISKQCMTIFFFFTHCTMFAFHFSAKHCLGFISTFFIPQLCLGFFSSQCQEKIQSRSRTNSQISLHLFVQCASFFILVQPSWQSWRVSEAQNSMWELNSHYGNLETSFDGLRYSSWYNDDSLI